MGEIKILYDNLLDKLVNLINIGDLDEVEDINEDFLNKLINFFTKD